MNGVFATWMLAATLSAAGGSGQWHNDYAEALRAAQSDSKPLLVVLHDPDQPQLSVKQVSHVESAQADSLASHYHLCQVDVSTPMGQQVAKAFRATSYPYTVITDKQARRIIFRKTGAFSDAQWTTTLADYRRGVRPISYSAPLVGAASGFCPNCR